MHHSASVVKETHCEQLMYIIGQIQFWITVLDKSNFGGKCDRNCKDERDGWKQNTIFTKMMLSFSKVKKREKKKTGL